jgi:hypothetical protein
MLQVANEYVSGSKKFIARVRTGKQRTSNIIQGLGDTIGLTIQVG